MCQLSICFGARCRVGWSYLCPHRVHNVRARQIPNLGRITNRDMEARLCRLLDANAGLGAASDQAWLRGLHGWRWSRPSLTLVQLIIVIVYVMRVGRRRSSCTRLRWQRRSDGKLALLLLWRLGRRIGQAAVAWRSVTCWRSKRSQRVILDAREFSRLCDESPRRKSGCA